MPLIMRWPNKIKPGITSNQVCATFDLTHSFLKLAQAEVSMAHLDGFDIVNHLTARKPDFERTLFWRGKRGERTWWAVRQGDLKYIRKTEGKTEEWLFDLSKDIGEKTDLSLLKPRQFALLKGLLADWEKEVKPGR